MGNEYSIRFKSPDHSSIEQALKQFPLHVESLLEPSKLEFRKTDSHHDMPDASIHIETGGLYFCDHGGLGREFLGQLVAALVSRFGSVTVAEYE